MAALGLRGKSLLALLLSCLLAFVFAGFIGRKALLGVQSRFGEAYARNVVQLNANACSHRFHANWHWLNGWRLRS
ncbi:hypothetical protein N5J76_15225 [Pseudomonas sp. GD03855]|nr:hypothetical protein [Pseudomonas sp. GD03856]MDH2266266.1 hypothetical protein [Pseudomonas sp. GD03855]